MPQLTDHEIAVAVLNDYVQHVTARTSGELAKMIGTSPLRVNKVVEADPDFIWSDDYRETGTNAWNKRQRKVMTVMVTDAALCRMIRDLRSMQGVDLNLAPYLRGGH